jgi:hypothetical protein
MKTGGDVTENADRRRGGCGRSGGACVDRPNAWSSIQDSAYDERPIEPQDENLPVDTATCHPQAFYDLISTAWRFTYHIVYIAYIISSPPLPSLPFVTPHTNYKSKSKSLSKFLPLYKSPSTRVDL